MLLLNRAHRRSSYIARLAPRIWLTTGDMHHPPLNDSLLGSLVRRCSGRFWRLVRYIVRELPGDWA